ncbi:MULTISPECIES: heme ABC exporter ATP-binding protein CcmA [unclassified Caulobacter]|uniref:heme ABC exporter ATP-binding protein CcmA n=1 Tax=unclassified Caulobacter TaxID=2648921 RepID=UPI000D37DA80|nr:MULTISPECIES: heme ABC exporter ATP-binding protein CcmA [unclassified Caulobacter]PTS89802.1 heme ABC exporter ATP-binding protein CcmA [Caulobacter sp. HMWF009]PTT05562.1 heme ABC exporter ATP-binding protein CcmA [Caulobacter sp. HMWF025]
MLRVVRIQDLAISRGERRLFSGFNLQVEPGEAVALTGRNGAGKTSLLRAVAGLLRPEAGAISFGDTEPETARAEHLHMVGHHDGLKSTRTAWEELRFQTLWTGGSEASARDAAQIMDLKRLLDLEVRRLSAGQRRRLALARLAASPRSLWLLDEPMAPLDAGHRSAFGAVMAGHLAGGGMIMAAVHDPLPVPCRTVEVGA